MDQPVEQPTSEAQTSESSGEEENTDSTDPFYKQEPHTAFLTQSLMESKMTIPIAIRLIYNLSDSFLIDHELTVLFTAAHTRLCFILSNIIINSNLPLQIVLSLLAETDHPQNIVKWCREHAVECSVPFLQQMFVDPIVLLPKRSVRLELTCNDVMPWATS